MGVLVNSIKDIPEINKLTILAMTRIRKGSSSLGLSQYPFTYKEIFDSLNRAKDVFEKKVKNNEGAMARITLIEAELIFEKLQSIQQL